MFLQIKNITDSLYLESQNYFSKKYSNSIKSKESLVARFIISKEFEKEYWIKNYLPRVDESWIPLFDNGIFWSISHKEDLVFIWIDDKKIWIDIEFFKERDISVLDQFYYREYNLIWWKNWNNFYTIWTAKESVIKYLNLVLDDMKNTELIRVKNMEKTINKIDFTKTLSLNYKSQQLQVFFWVKDNIFYSVCSICE